MKRRVQSQLILFAVLCLVILPWRILSAGVTSSVDETYLRCAITVYFPDSENTYTAEVTGPGGTFNKSNAGSCYIEGTGKATINYGYLPEESSITLKAFNSSGSEVSMKSFVLSEKSKGTFLVSIPDTAATPTPIPSPTPEPTRPPEATPTPVPPIVINTPTPTPKNTDTPTPTPSDTPTPTPSETPTPTETPTPSPSPSPVPTDTPSPTPSDTPTPEPTVESTKEPTVMPTDPTDLQDEPEEPPKEDSGFVQDVKEVVAAIPGAYIDKETNELRIKPGLILASTALMFVIGFISSYLIRSHIYKRKDTIAMFFNGIEEEDREEEDNK